MKEKRHPVQWICKHLFGEEHTELHKITLGAFLAVTGVSIMMVECEHFWAIFAVHTVGSTVHAIGVVPLIENLMKSA